MKTFMSAAIIAVLGLVLVNDHPVNASDHNAADNTVATVTYCELIKHSKRFHDKVVRVTGILAKGFEKSSLFDEGDCSRGKPANGSAQSDTWVSYDQSFVLDGDSAQAKLNDSISGFGQWWVVAVGKFRRAEGSQKFGHLRCCKYEFAVIRVEQSEKLPTR